MTFSNYWEHACLTKDMNHWYIQSKIKESACAKNKLETKLKDAVNLFTFYTHGSVKCSKVYRGLKSTFYKIKR